MPATGLVPAQSVQEAIAARKAAAEVRRRLAGFAAGKDAISGVDAYMPGERRRGDEAPVDEDAFRRLLVSFRG